MKHISTVLEASIPFHTLVKLVDAADITNDKIRTHDLTLEVNKITKQLQTQTLYSSQQEQLMCTQPRDPNTKNKPAYKKYCSMMKTKEMLMQDQNLLRNQLYNAFVLRQTTEQNEMIHDIEVEVHHEIIIITETTIHKIDIALHLEIDLFMTKLRILHNTLDPDMTIINETRDLIDPPTNHIVDVILVTDIDHAHTQETTIILRDTHLSLDHLQDLEILDFLDLAHIRKQEKKALPYNHKFKTIQFFFEVHMYHPTEMANAVTPTKWFYS